MKKYTSKEKRLDYYDLGDGITLLNILTKTSDGVIDKVDTYIGSEEAGFIHVGGTADGLSKPGVFFKYNDYIKMIEYNRETFLQIYKENLNSGYRF